MKSGNADTLKLGRAIIERLETEGVKTPDMPLGPRYLNNAPFKFGGKKRSPSNSGGRGRAGRRQKRVRK